VVLLSWNLEVDGRDRHSPSGHTNKCVIANESKANSGTYM
jgi:hypothetical protein